MTTTNLIGSIAIFFAALLLVQGLADVWKSLRGNDAKRLDKRLRQLRGERERGKSRGKSGSNSGGSGAVDPKSLKLARSYNDERSRVVEEFLSKMPRYGTIEADLRQAGSDIGAGRFIVNAAMLAAATAFAVFLLTQQPLHALGAAVVAAYLPFLWLRIRRSRRRNAFERQLPDAIDLIARALRAGHAFTPSLQMVADEVPSPVGGEFRQTADEIAFGIPVQDALVNLARRMPLENLRFFVIATLLQRETGGNLAEILDNISRLIRERFKLLGHIRVLTAEGRLSAWILTALPFGTALMFQLVNPGFIKPLFADPFGIKLVITAGIAMLVGILWMWRLVKIRI